MKAPLQAWDMAARFLAVVVLGMLALGATGASAHDKFRFIGTVLKMEVKKKLLTMKTSDEACPTELEIDIRPKTRIEQNGRKAGGADLEPGAHVVVDAVGDDYFDVAAVVVKIVPPPSK